MYGKSYWYGKEVEGRLSDIETVFVRGAVPKNYKDGLSRWIMKPLFKSCEDLGMVSSRSWARVFFAISPKSCYFF